MARFLYYCVGFITTAHGDESSRNNDARAQRKNGHMERGLLEKWCVESTWIERSKKVHEIKVDERQ